MAAVGKPGFRGGAGRAFLGAAWRSGLVGIGLSILRAICPVSAGATLPRADAPRLEGAGLASRTIVMARATRDTGWFQTEILVGLLEAQGYAVTPPRTMESRAFYLAAARAEVDLWVNGWFPRHNVFLKQENVGGQVTTVGLEVTDGALQGYRVAKRTAWISPV